MHKRITVTGPSPRARASLNLAALVKTGEIYKMGYAEVRPLVDAAYRENETNLRTIAWLLITTSPETLDKHSANLRALYPIVHNGHTKTSTLQRIANNKEADAAIRHIANEEIEQRARLRR